MRELKAYECLPGAGNAGQQNETSSFRPRGVARDLRNRQERRFSRHPSSLDVRKFTLFHQHPGSFNQARKWAVGLLLEEPFSLDWSAGRCPLEIVKKAVNRVEANDVDPVALSEPAASADENQRAVDRPVRAIS